MSKVIDRLHLDHLVIAAAIFVGFVSATSQLDDNSLLVHIRTGMTILHTHHVPRSDPYSFSAHGQPWTVESWLPELLYAVAIKVGGGHLLQLLNAVLFATVAGVIAKLARANDLGRSLLGAAVAIGIGYFVWTPRPTMFGLLFFSLTVLVVTKRRHFLWLVPIGLLWVNSHGSWPIGLVWIGLCGIGTYFDKENYDDHIKYASSLFVAVIVGGLASPAGADILRFPQVAFGPKSTIFRSIAEWKSPNFGSADLLSGRLVLVAFIAAVVLLTRKHQKWSELFPAIVLIGAALAGQRNLALLGVGLAPLFGRALSVPMKVPDVGMRRMTLVGLVAFIACGGIDLVATFQKNAYSFEGYPVAAMDWLNNQSLVGPGHRLAAPDGVGCYMVYRFGDRANNFIDDRYDMYPVHVATDYIQMNRVTDSTSEILNRYDFDAVLFAKDAPLSIYLSVNPAWKQVYADKHWRIFEPISS